MKKIMFNDRYELTTYVLARMKTMTRRIIKPQPMPPSENYRIDNSGTLLEKREYDKKWGGGTYEVSHGKINTSCAPYKVGEIVAVAQSYENCGYRPDEIVWKREDKIIFQPLHVDSGWKNKMFVRADMMPNQIRITSVRAERLQDISEEDCLKEYPKCDEMIKDHLKTAVSYGGSPKNNTMSRRDVFAHLIDKISGKGTWESNPWVWVYEFELIK